MDRAEAVKRIKTMQKLGFTPASKEALDLAIEALKAEPRQHHLGKHADITVIDEVETHEIRTETHGVCSDLISRADTIKAMCLECDIDEKCDVWIEGTDQMCTDVEIVKGMPPAATDISEYSDRLWEAAYERGKAEGAEELKYMRQRNAQLETMLHAQMAISADAAPQLKQTDTLLIADALRYLMQDTNRHLADRTRADALREQMLAYGARMCKPPTERTVGWIPVSERLPEEEKEVLVTVHFMGLKQTHPNGWNDHIKPSNYVDIASRIDEEWSSASDEYKIARNRHKTIAWQPLPEPYKGGDTE